MNTVRVPVQIGDVTYSVEVQMPGQFSASVVDVFLPSGQRLPAVDYEAHNFDDLQLDLCIAKALRGDGVCA